MSKSAKKSAASATVSSPHVTTSGSSERISSPLSPTRLTRLQEKHELQNLNDRLAAYIDRVRYLEAENSLLTTQVATSQETVTREVSSIKSMYERELNDTRRLIDETSRDKARLSIECDKWKSQLSEVEHKLKKREKDFQTAEKKLINAENLNQELQSRLSQLSTEKKRADEALKEAEAERDRLASNLAAVKLQLEEETVYKVDLLNKLQSVKEELTFKESIHEREMSESRVLKQVDISEIDVGWKGDYEEQLSKTLQEIREQYESQMRINRDEIESLYEAKIADLQLLLDKASSTAMDSRDESRSLKSSVETLSSKITELEAQNESLRNRIKDLERLLAQEREWHQGAMQAKDDEIKALRMDIEKQLEEYQDLLDIKIALDMEITAYRKLLEVEETRLKITPGRRSSSSDTRATPTRQTPLRAKRKRAVFETGGSSSSSDFQSSSSAKGDVEIQDHDPEGKFVKLFNKGSSDISLSGWQLVRKAGEQETIHKFRRDVVIKPNAHITVWSSDSKATHSPPSDIVMKGQKWFTADVMTTTLTNSDGEEMAVRESSKRIHRSSEQRSFLSSRFSEELYHQQGDPENPQERCLIM